MRETRLPIYILGAAIFNIGHFHTGLPEETPIRISMITGAKVSRPPRGHRSPCPRPPINNRERRRNRRRDAGRNGAVATLHIIPLIITFAIIYAPATCHYLALGIIGDVNFQSVARPADKHRGQHRARARDRLVRYVRTRLERLRSRNTRRIT